MAKYKFCVAGSCDTIEAKDKDDARKKMCKEQGYTITKVKNSFPCDFRLLAQRDPQWKNVRLGSSWHTVGGDGCLITSISMFGYWGCSDVNPGDLARNLKYTKGGYLIWNSINNYKALNMDFVWRYYRYDREKIKSILRSYDHVCVVQVPFGSGKHWMAVVNYDSRKGFVCADPWTKKYVYASKYGNITGFAELKIKH